MAAPALSPAAGLVRRMDPDLFHAALFAPESARERLMVLYAFDIELSRAAETPSEPLVARMRLQFWRDVVEGARMGEPPRQHEVAAPLHGLMTEAAIPAGDLEALIAAREMELEGPMDTDRFAVWLDARFGALARSAVRLLAGEDEAARRAAGLAGQAMELAFALRAAAPMAAEANTFLLPGLEPDDRARLARGRTTENARAVARDLAERGLKLLAAARAERRRVPPAAVPALLPLWRAERVLRRARQPGADLPGLTRTGEEGGRALALIWRALSGRW